MTTHPLDRQLRRRVLIAAIFLFISVLACSPITPLGPKSLIPEPQVPSAYQAILDVVNTDVGYLASEQAEQKLPSKDHRNVDNGDTVNVYDAGEALLSFHDYLQVHVFRNSKLKVETKGLINPQTSGVFGYSLVGTTYVVDKWPDKALQHVEVTTPNGVVIKTLGTEFLVYYSPTMQATWVVVKEGEVEVTAADQTVIVPRHFQTTVFGSSTPLPPVPATRAIVRDIFPLVDDLTINTMADDAVLDNQQCTTNALAYMFERADVSAAKVGILPARARFEALWQTENAAWIFGIDPKTKRWVWVSGNRLNCSYPVTLLVDMKKIIDWVVNQNVVDPRVVIAVFEGKPLDAEEPNVSPTVSPIPIVPPSFTVDAVQVISIDSEPNPVCPIDATFEAAIYASGAGTVTYKWEYGDGTVTPQEAVTFDSDAVQRVRMSRSFVSSSNDWVLLHILTPNEVWSEKTDLRVVCDPPTADFSGYWYHNFGTMELAQIDNVVSGKYFSGLNNSEGMVQGTVSGNTVNGTWQLGASSGIFQWALNGSTFDGNSGDSYQWCGARDGIEFPAGCSFAGAWTTSLPGTNDNCPLTLTRVNNVVSGESCYGTLSGSIVYDNSDAILIGPWPGGGGSFTFFIPAFDAKYFQGNWDGTSPWCGWRVDSSVPEPCLKPLPAGVLSPFVVDSVSTIRVYPESSITCPTTFSFEAEIYAQGRGTIAYQWEYSDGNLGNEEIVPFNSEGTLSVKTSWAISSSYSGWVRLHVLQPSDVVFKEAAFTLICEVPPASKNTEISVYATSDIYVNQNAPDTNYARINQLRVSQDEFLQEAFALLRFDLSTIPADATINSATFYAHLGDTGEAPDTARLSIYWVRRTWNASTVTWNTQPATELTSHHADVQSVAGGYYAWDVTDMVLCWFTHQALCNDASLALRAHPDYNAPFFRGFDNRSSSNKPYLLIEYIAPTNR